MATLKTQPTRASVSAFLAAIDDADRRRDCRALAALLGKATGSPPKMWGASIVGFGDYHYKYASGREGDWFVAGFSPRKEALTIYLATGSAADAALLKKLGKYKGGKACLYVKQLADIDVAVLEKIVRESTRRLHAHIATQRGADARAR